MKKERYKIRSEIQHVVIAMLVVLLTTSAFDLGNKKNRRPIVSKIEIRGIYGSPEPFWKKNLQLNEFGVNAICLHHETINDSIMERAKSEGLKVFAEFATLNGKQ